MEEVFIDLYMPEIYMEYAASTIIDRALPDVRDGLKPVHRRILYAMYHAKITHDKNRAKSTSPVSETMKIHHHGDSSIYEALALLTEQNETLLHPFIDGEGAFGDVFSKDKPSAARYTTCRLNKFAQEMFKDMNKNVVRMIGGEDGYLQPEILPNTFPNILIKPNEGIAVGQSCCSPSFNLKEVCQLAIDMLLAKEPYPIAPDFPSKAQIINNEKAFEDLLYIGEANITLLGKWRVKNLEDKKRNIIEVYEIPYNTTVGDIVDKIKSLLLQGKLKEVIDVRDETGFNLKIGKKELLIAIDIKKNADPEKIMQYIVAKTPIKKNMSIKMNFLVNNIPKVMGVAETLKYWIKFRKQCIEKAWIYDLNKLEKEYNEIQLLLRFKTEIDTLIQIITSSKTEKLCIKALQQHFSISKEEAEQLTGIKLINLTKDFFAAKEKRFNELEKSILKLKKKLSSDKEIAKEIVAQLQYCIDNYSKPRQTVVINEIEAQNVIRNYTEQYPCYILITKEGYIKKNIRYSENQKLKDGDSIMLRSLTSNVENILVFTNQRNMYTLKISKLDEVLPSSLGQYIPALLDLPADEQVVGSVLARDYKGSLIVGYSNGRFVKIKLSSFKTNREKITKALMNDSDIVFVLSVGEDIDLFCKTQKGKGLIFNTVILEPKESRTSQGTQVMKLKNGDSITSISLFQKEMQPEIYDKYYLKNGGVGKLVERI